MDVESLRTPEERTRRRVCLVISVIAWIVLVVGTIGVAVLYGLFIALFVIAAHAMLIAHIKGNGVRISEKQFPELHDRIAALSKAMGLPKAPEAYVVQAGGILNALATKFAGRNFIVLFSDLLEAAPSQAEVDMIVGHELGHLALGHLRRRWFLWPSMLVPLLGPAYSRACEYSCDRIGMEAAGGLEPALRGLCVLAAGGKYGARVDPVEFVRQQEELGRFWMAVAELSFSHPYLARRVAALIHARNPGTVPVRRSRNPFAYPLAPLLGFAAGPAGAAPLMVIFMIGVLAAVAVPNFVKFQERARAQEYDAVLETMAAAAGAYKEEAGELPCDADKLPLADAVRTQLQQAGWEPQVNCEAGWVGIVYGDAKTGKRKLRARILESGAVQEVELAGEQ